ncbi:hypothetical protein HF086_011585 [Spodoptera exigua]|uniref:C2H2-type domain-containing protein n=1 Tax=Spodoptera exigua TaxID=7107 RepID=A0A922SE51_SPOEX|nr:hypothetical protein HF086_011585 [Spodoptera exigua]
MMFSDEEIKEEIKEEMPDRGFMQPGDEIISIREVCLSDKFDFKVDKKDLGFSGEPLLSTSSRNDLDVPRSLFRDGFFSDGLEQQQARFAWTEEDGNIASLVSEPGPKCNLSLKPFQEADTSSAVLQSTNRNGITFSKKIFGEPHLVSSTSAGTSGTGKVTNIHYSRHICILGINGYVAGTDRGKGPGTCKVDKADPRSRFHFVKYVKRHGRTVKLWECGICSREFQHQYTLMRHLPTHTDERNFHCVACGKSFRQLSTLSQHRAIHSAERPYACEVCNKTFNRVSTLISHRKTHSDEKPYRCHICPKGFHQKGNLRNHLFTHTNERPYRCNICLRGFNQQSNLVCHKNKKNIRIKSSKTKTILYYRPQVEHCEVSSSVGPYLPSMSSSVEGPSSSTWTTKDPWELPKPYFEPGDIWNEGPWASMSSGVIVDPIKTYHMGVALATRQTPFALLKPDNGTPVLVKVVDTKLPGGKQMLVPATAEDLRVGGKIVLNNDTEDGVAPHGDIEPKTEANGAVQIRVPVVATVVPRIKPGGRLQLTVEEPHHAYHTALSADVGEVNVEPCTSRNDLRIGAPSALTHPEPRRLDSCSGFDDGLRTGTRISSTCALPPPAPSPPLDLISMDLFEPMECIAPLGPQITAVDNIDQGPPSDDSDIFIGEFENCIMLSDTD